MNLCRLSLAFFIDWRVVYHYTLAWHTWLYPFISGSESDIPLRHKNNFDCQLSYQLKDHIKGLIPRHIFVGRSARDYFLTQLEIYWFALQANGLVFFAKSQQIKIELVPKLGFADTASKTTMDSAYASYKRSAGSSATSKSSSQASVFMDYQVKLSCFRHLSGCERVYWGYLFVH